MVTAIEIATGTSTGTMQALIEIATATNGVEENMNVADTDIQAGSMSLRTTALMDTARTLTSRVTGTACSPVQAMRGAARATIRNARIFTAMAREVFFQSSATPLPTAWPIAMVSCAVMKKAIATIRAISTAAAFIHSADEDASHYRSLRRIDPNTAAIVTPAPMPTMIRTFRATECPRLSSTLFTSAYFTVVEASVLRSRMTKSSSPAL